MLKLNEKPINYKGDNLYFYGTNYISCPENIAIAVETEFHEPYCTLTVNLSDYGYVFRNGTIAIGFANSILVQLLPDVYEKIKENIKKEELEENE